MKLTLSVLAAGLALTCFPALFAGGDAPAGPAAGCSSSLAVDLADRTGIDAILATIRARESGGDYTAQAPGSSASGAYQFTDATWANYGGHQRAADAPADVQDAKAAMHVRGILDANAGDLTAVPVAWYIGYVPTADDPAWDEVPSPGAGNRLTPRGYQAEWLAAYEQHGGDIPGGCVVAGLALPAPADLFARAPVDDPHHDYPAWDWALPSGTPLFAIRGGEVVSVTTWARNWFDVPCRSGERCSRCGIGVTILDSDGTRWNYCHGSRLLVAAGDHIPTGHRVLDSGHSGRSTTPHLHLAIRTSDGQARCPQPLLTALQSGTTPPNPADLPTTGCIG